MIVQQYGLRICVIAVIVEKIMPRKKIVAKIVSAREKPPHLKDLKA
jgi:hypothetical protein